MFKDTLKVGNLYLRTYWSNFFINSSKKAFSILVKPMIKGITEEEIDFLYLTLDRNGDNKLQLSEFEDAM